MLSSNASGTAKPGAALNRCLFLVLAAWVIFLLGKSFLFGSQEGNYWNAFYRDPPLSAVCFGFASGLAFAVLIHFSFAWVERHPRLVLLGWLVVGFGFQWAARAFYIMPLRTLVVSEGINSFYSVSLEHKPAEMLSRFLELQPILQLHGRTNMPGKTFIYYFFELFTRDPTAMGGFVIALSCLASALLYAVAMEWFRDRQVALTAAVLSLLLPSKIGFLPLLNTVTPGFIVLSLWLWLLYLRKQRAWLLLLLGASLYLLAFVDPLPFTMGLIFIGALAQRVLAREYEAKQLWKVALWVPAGFMVVFVALWAIFGFNLFAAFRVLLDDLVASSARLSRPYAPWVVHNLKEYLANSGLLSSLVFLLALYELAAGAIRARFRGDFGARAILSNPGSNLLLGVALTLLIVDVIGLNRGETSRVWIYQAFFLSLCSAWLCAKVHGVGTTRLVVASLAIQAAITTSSVEFLGTHP